MLSATLRRATRLARAPRLARGMAEEAAAATGMTLNFTVPASAIYENVPAEMVLVRDKPAHVDLTIVRPSGITAALRQPLGQQEEGGEHLEEEQRR